MAECAFYFQPLRVSFVLLFLVLSADACIQMKDLSHHPLYPSSVIKTVNYPGESILPVGSRVTISCSSNRSKNFLFGNPDNAQPYMIELYINKRYIDGCGGNRKDRKDTKTCTFVIRNATKMNSGVFECTATNLHDYCTSATILLHFEDPSPPRFTINPPREIYVSAENKKNFTCGASGVPTPNITWYKDGVPVPRKKTLGVKSVSLLVFESVSFADQGNYWCEAKNSFGWNRSSDTTLNIAQEPAITFHPQTTSAYIEGNFTVVSFQCKATGNPTPGISWLRNNSTKANGTVFQAGSISTLLLVLPGRKKTSSCKYNCIAKNSFGKAYSKEGTLNIVDKKSRNAIYFYGHPQNITASLGDHVMLICAAEGSPVPEITWLKDDRAILDKNATLFRGYSSSTSSLALYSVEENHSGRYACQTRGHMVTVTSKEAVLSITGK
ncbi:peroxidasin-like [Montipora foliosa]|uniref:peroxidasin-like n=1 Tax=Montipora foliosa TaxID=591990 RepID=UPI0035F1A4C5